MRIALLVTMLAACGGSDDAPTKETAKGPAPRSFQAEPRSVSYPDDGYIHTDIGGRIVAAGASYDVGAEFPIGATIVNVYGVTPGFTLEAPTYTADNPGEWVAIIAHNNSNAETRFYALVSYKLSAGDTLPQ